MRALLFTKEHCPRCPPVKEWALANLGDVELVDCGTEKGMEMAKERWVMSTPTVVMIDGDGGELWRANSVEELLSRVSA